MISNRKDEKKFDLSGLYLDHINNQNFFYDEEQFRVVKEIEKSLNSTLKKKNLSSFFRKIITNHGSKNAFYLYGSVGSGKSFLTNLIFKNFPESNNRKKIRLTFYNLINELRSQVNSIVALSQEKKNFLVKKILDEKFASVALLCIDEFHILDITDAMMIGEFLKIVFRNSNMVILINSNRHPVDLYKDGIHKERFYPIIDLIKKNSNIIHLSTLDYRNYLRGAPKNYFIFLKNDVVKNSDDFFQKYLNENYNKCENQEIELVSQKIKFLLNTHFTYKVAYFEFNNLFDKFFYAQNYQELFKKLGLRRIFINNIPNMDDHDDWAKRFISFVDVAYEYSIHLVFSSCFSPEELYTRGKMIFEFNRTISRINVLCQ